MTTREELEQHESELEIVEEALLTDPGNAELIAARDSLNEVISLARELLKSTAAPQTTTTTTTRKPAAAAATPTAARGEGEFTAGSECEALHTRDKRWYNAVVREVREDGYVVSFGGTTEAPTAVAKASVRAKAAPPEGSGTKKKKKEAGATAAPTEIPKWLKIKPTDSEKTKIAKKKRIHAVKSQMRFAKMEAEVHEKQSSWQTFVQKKGPKKESIFRSPETATGKVGVTGSGRGMTPEAGFREKVKKVIDPSQMIDSYQ